MPHSPRFLKLAALPLCVAGSAGALALAPAAGAKPAMQRCSTSGLSFSEKQGSMTLGDDVVALRAVEVGCGKARSLARTVAKDILQERTPPHTIDGLAVTLKEPCTGCTPDTRVVAKAASKRVSFTVRGGA
ncbi:MAG TPA: hypothetical protein VGF95_09830 [Solirubrobacteraceae bacterium]|jgi:hypothetical protein